MTHVKYIDKHLNKQNDFNPRQSHIEYEQDALSCKMHSGVKLKILFSKVVGATCNTELPLLAGFWDNKKLSWIMLAISKMVTNKNILDEKEKLFIKSKKQKTDAFRAPLHFKLMNKSV